MELKDLPWNWVSSANNFYNEYPYIKVLYINKLVVITGAIKPAKTLGNDSRLDVIKDIPFANNYKPFGWYSFGDVYIEPNTNILKAHATQEVPAYREGLFLIVYETSDVY